MNRFDRVTSILIQLQSRKVVKAQDLAERFGVSLRTIYRDIRSLEEAGVPLYGEAGIGYSMADGYRLPPVIFTKDEAIAFLTAEKLIEKLTDWETSKNYKEAMFKIRAVLKVQEKELLEEVEERIIVRRKYNPLRKNDNIKLLPTILQSIANKQVLAMEYVSVYQQEKTSRCLEPLGVFYESNNWHMIAFCRLRKDYRDFRVDRITGLKVTDDYFEDQHPSLSEYLDDISERQNLIKVAIRMSRDTARYIEQEKLYYGFVMETEAGKDLEMTFLTQSIEGFARWMMMFGDNATVIEPAELKERIGALALKTLALYQS